MSRSSTGSVTDARARRLTALAVLLLAAVLPALPAHGAADGALADTTADVTGTMTIKGVAKPVTVPVKFTYLKDKLGLRVPNQKGDLLVIRANFAVKRSDFGINPKAPEDKVADTIDLTLSIAGASPK